MTRQASSRTAVVLALACLSLAVCGAALASPAQPHSSAVSLSSLEQGVLAEINALRAEHKLAPLRVSVALAAAAREHSQQMADQGYFAHESGDGSPFSKRLQHFYPQGKAYWSVGENLLWSSPDVEPGRALQLWLDSPEHRANLLNARWREIGVSAVHVPAAPGTFRGLDVTIVTTDFGVRR
jgi:uncharacterized protein YkwD